MSLKKQKYLTLYEKSLVIQGLNDGQRVTYLAKKYGVAKSTISKIKQNREIISNTVKNTYLGPGKRKTLKSSEFPRMEKELYDWFLDQRSKNVFVSGEIIKQQAKLIHSRISENDKEFTASDGWLQRFKKRFGIRFLKISRQNLSSQPALVDPFLNIGNNEQNEGRDDVGQRSKQRVSDCQKNEQKSSFEISQLFIKEEQPSTSISFYPEKTESVLEPSMDIKETIIIKQEEGTTSSFLSQNEYDNNQEDVTSFLDNTTKGTSTDKHLSSEGQESNDEEDVNDCTDVIIKNEPQSPVSRSEDGDQGIMGDTDDLLGNQKSDKAIQVNVKPRMKSVSIQTGPIVCECCLKLKK